MPEATTPQGASSTALKPDADVVIPRLQLGEQGVIGLRTSNKHILEEPQAAFRYPAFIETVNQMRNNPTVGAAMNVYRMMISRVRWDIELPMNASATDTARANVIKTMMDDMEHSWSSFVESVIPYLEYGFGINEKVYRRRLTRNGSKFNDGLVGVRKLPTRSQDTIYGWNFSEDGADLLGVEQNLRYIENAYRFINRTNEMGRLTIDREKFLLFSASANKGNPEGNSIYKKIYLAFKQLTLLQDQELLGVTKDIQGMLKIGIPPRYMAADASNDDKAVYAGFQQIIANYNAGQQAGLLVPIMTDANKNPMFTYDMLADRGQPKYDTEAIIKRLQNDILSALSVDVLKMGMDGGGSFSLADAKTSILALAIDYRLREICEVLNSDLMRDIYALNGWSQENMAKFCYSDVEQVSLDELGKFIQRVASTSMIEVDRPVMNRIRVAFGVPALPDDEPVDKTKLSATLTGQETAAGAGMEPGTSGDGTSKTPVGKGKKDSSTNNADNAS